MLLLTMLACKGDDDNTPADDTGEVSTLVCEEPVEPSFIDDMIQDLSLHDDKVSTGEVSNSQDGADFLSTVDASAGGYKDADENPAIYVRFTDTGLERVDIDDEAALESMDWDLALKRFIIRVNSGDSGPSCVGAATMLGFEYADLTSVPEGIEFRPDDFYTDDCTEVKDSSGLEAPQVAMASWWTYESCVETSGTPFLIQLQSGKVLRLVVEAYYAGDGQEECNTKKKTNEEGGFYQLRWAWL